MKTIECKNKNYRRIIFLVVIYRTTKSVRTMLDKSKDILTCEYNNSDN